ncbi:MAG: serine/threonine-protein phosphatase [Microscillaceae bacterium]|nr:serine/threonine-protein phosphatase [Microscillaceae bacterium]
MQRLTRDHSFVQALIDQGVIQESEAESHPRRNELLRALGTEPFVDVEVIREPFQPDAGDLFLLCSDGLNSLVSDRGIEEVLAEPEEIQAKAIQLVNLANTLGGHDNTTVQLVEILTPGHSRAFQQSTAQGLDTQHASPLSYTQPQNNFDPPLSYEKKKSPLDVWPEEEQENRPKKRADHIEINDSGLPDLKPGLLRGFVILVALVFLYVIFQNTLGKSAYVGSSGSLTQDSARAIALQTWFYDYTGIQKAKNTYQKAKQTITDLNELKKRKLRALDSLFRNKRLRKIANQLEENGESVEDLALRYRSKVDWILKANGVDDAAALQNLDSLAIPLEAPKSPLP